MGWQDVTPSDSVEAADWIPQRLHGFAENVGSVVPTGFDAYARIFHPASTGTEYPGIEVRWSEVAAWAGKTVHPEMQFHAIAAPGPGQSERPSPWTYEPRLGVLSARQTGALAELLSTYTTTPNACWLCLWEGYGYDTAVALWSTYVGPPKRRIWPRFGLQRLRIGLPRSIRGFPGARRRSAPSRGHASPPPSLGALRFGELLKRRKRVRLPGRDYLLFKGSTAQAQGWEDGPNLWWPEDRAWCVASEIDFPYSYVGGSHELIEEILQHPALEALPATIEHGISSTSDTVNS